MSMKVKVWFNATIFDIAIMATGTPESVFAILAANNKGLTEIPHVGDTYIIPDGVATDEDTLNKLAELGYGLNPGQMQLATGNDPNLYVGIGYWQIEVDFKVS